jgi:hypothetical protein
LISLSPFFASTSKVLPSFVISRDSVLIRMNRKSIWWLLVHRIQPAGELQQTLIMDLDKVPF